MNILIFGATGSIGNFIYREFKRNNIFNVIGTSSKHHNNYININCFDDTTLINLDTLIKIDIVVWCQGLNSNDNIEDLDLNNYEKIMNCNCTFIIKTLNYLLNKDILNNNSKLCIISSLWQNIVRNNKFSYSVSKSALSGLVKSIAIDLSKKNILINNILPGPVDNDMTKKTLNKEQYEKVFNHTGFNRLPQLLDIYNLVYFLCITNNCITGQSINIDLGMSIYKNL